MTKEHLTAAAKITSEIPPTTQTSAPVSTTTAALAGSEDNSSPHWISDYTGRDGPFRSLSPSARGLPSPLETARALIAASDRKEALTGRRVMRRAGEKGGATQEGGEKKREGKVRSENFSKKKLDRRLILMKLEDLLALQKSERHVAMRGSKRSRKRGESRRSYQSLRNPIPSTSPL